MGKLTRFSSGIFVVTVLALLSVILAGGALFRASGGTRARAHVNVVSRPFNPTHDQIHLPRVMLWAWERPEDLRFIDPRTTGVSFLAGTIEITSRSSNAGVVLHPRLQPLRVPPGTSLMAVVRIESPNDLWRQTNGRRNNNPAPSATHLYSDEQRIRIAETIASFASLAGLRAVQLDYDATQSEREFYRALLQDVRKRLPQAMPLSITALASWCIGDLWLDSLPEGTLDEAVPMLFRMGPDAAQVASFLQTGDQFPARACRGSLGISTDEEFSQAVLSGDALPGSGRNSRRIYIFSAKPWTQASVKQIDAEVEQWQGGSRESR